MTDIGRLRRAVRNEPLEGAGGWAPGLDVDGFLRKVTAELNGLPSVVVEVSS
ncbi:hypothetical protein BZB76_2053 [Actinomadura pelletieri DSM 43383]|uniref:Uncharacterized protein n=1 Tax=Actinomadura pelletieri DSM 43383 TaxID=1120940 RepID=A0A495QT59_9ACTN|nr:hypothetical protein BZB76_2053 [Actinomadura pelletieri DSM 43383]